MALPHESWTEKRVGDAVVETWKRYRPEELLRAIDSEPVELVGSGLELHRFRSHVIAVRRPVDDEQRERIELFLRNSVRGRGPLLGLPMGIIYKAKPGQAPTETIFVTKWRHGTPFSEYARDPAVSLERKVSAMMRGIGQLAEVHRTGFVQSDPHEKKFIVQGNGAVRLVGISLVRPGSGGTGRGSADWDLQHAIALMGEQIVRSQKKGHETVSLPDLRTRALQVYREVMEKRVRATR